MSVLRRSALQNKTNTTYSLLRHCRQQSIQKKASSLFRGRNRCSSADLGRPKYRFYRKTRHFTRKGRGEYFVPRHFSFFLLFLFFLEFFNGVFFFFFVLVWTEHDVLASGVASVANTETPVPKNNAACGFLKTRSWGCKFATISSASFRALFLCLSL